MMTNEEYSNASGCLCPVCESGNVSHCGGYNEHKDFKCDDCGLIWDEVVQITGFNNLRVKFTVDKFHYDKNAKCFFQDISYLQLKTVLPPTITLINERTRIERDFKFEREYKAERHGDTAGWRYKSGNLSLKIFND